MSNEENFKRTIAPKMVLVPEGTILPPDTVYAVDYEDAGGLEYGSVDVWQGTGWQVTYNDGDCAVYVQPGTLDRLTRVELEAETGILRVKFTLDAAVTVDIATGEVRTADVFMDTVPDWTIGHVTKLNDSGDEEYVVSNRYVDVLDKAWESEWPGWALA